MRLISSAQRGANSNLSALRRHFPERDHRLIGGKCPSSTRNASDGRFFTVSQLSFDLSGGVATITITNPPLATMDSGTVSEIADLIPRLRAPDVRAVVFTGGVEGYFIRHYSVIELDRSAQGVAAEPAEPRRPVDLHDLLLEIENLPKPVICALNGTAMGGAGSARGPFRRARRWRSV
jgi:1,4-dihydroxy-2-naphthoyl-CoA synthase